MQFIAFDTHFESLRVSLLFSNIKSRHENIFNLQSPTFREQQQRIAKYKFFSRILFWKSPVNILSRSVDFLNWNWYLIKTNIGEHWVCACGLPFYFCFPYYCSYYSLTFVFRIPFLVIVLFQLINRKILICQITDPSKTFDFTILKIILLYIVFGHISFAFISIHSSKVIHKGYMQGNAKGHSFWELKGSGKKCHVIFSACRDCSPLNFFSIHF